MQLCNLGYIINIYCRDLFPKPESFSGINIRETSSSTERCIKGAESLLHCLPANMLDVHDRGTFVKQVIEKKMFDAKAFKKDTFVEKSVTADIIPKELDNVRIPNKRNELLLITHYTYKFTDSFAIDAMSKV